MANGGETLAVIEKSYLTVIIKGEVEKAIKAASNHGVHLIEPEKSDWQHTHATVAKVAKDQERLLENWMFKEESIETPYPEGTLLCYD